MRVKGFAAFARPVSSTALCATVYVPMKDGPEPGNVPKKRKVAAKTPKKKDLKHHIDEIYEGEVVLAPWIDARHGLPAILELYGRGADTICVMRKKGKVAICGFKEGLTTLKRQPDSVCPACGKPVRCRNGRMKCGHCGAKERTNRRKTFPKPKWAVDQTTRSSGLVEDVCEHGVGHPNEHWLKANPKLEYLSIHGCDGCCSRR